jgi:hypothetical protein
MACGEMKVAALRIEIGGNDLVLYLCDPLRAALCLLCQPFHGLAQATVLLLQLPNLNHTIPFNQTKSNNFSQPEQNSNQSDQVK